MRFPRLITAPVVPALLFLFPLSAAFAIPVSSIGQIVSFGDSLSDNGNVSIATQGAIPGPNYGTRNYPGVPFAVGMFTDGPNTTPATTGPLGLWVDQFAAKLGVPDPTPTLLGGTNYAFAGADTGTDSAAGGVPFLSDQLLRFNIATNSNAPGNALYTFWAGANDIADQKNPVTAADNIFNNIVTLSGEGARFFLWLNLPPLGQTPSGLASGQSALLNAASNAFNLEWAADLARLRGQGIQVVGVDIAALSAQIAANPAFGITNLTGSAQGNAGANPNTYLFWDGDHPTTAADALIANLAFNDLVAVPEPSSTVLFLLGSFSMLAAGRRIRAKSRA